MAQINLPDSRKLPSGNYSSANRLEPVISHQEASSHKGSFLERIFSSGASSSANNIWAHLYKNIVGPTMQDLFYNIVVGASRMLIYGNDSGQSYTPSGIPVNTQRRNYSAISQNGNRFNAVTTSATRSEERDWRTYNEFDYGSDAEKVLAAMRRRIEQRGKTSIGDLCDLTRVRNFDFTLDSWGWFDLSQAEVRYSLGKFRITFPEPVYLGDIQ